MDKFRADIYDNPTVMDAIRAADHYRDRNLRDGEDTHFTVWAKSVSEEPLVIRVFVRPQGDTVEGATALYDTEEGRYCE